MSNLNLVCRLIQCESVIILFCDTRDLIVEKSFVPILQTSELYRAQMSLYLITINFLVSSAIIFPISNEK